jgi:PAS domain S-box-containing protein
MNELPPLLSTLNILAQISDAVLATDLDGRVLFWNAGAERLYGWTAADALGQSANDLLKTRFADPFERILDSLLREGRWEGEITRSRKGGEPIAVLSRWTVLREENGAAVARMVIDTDLTETKFRFDELRREEGYARAQAKLLFRVLDATSDFAFLKDPNGRYLVMNEAAARALGKTPQEVVGKDDFAVFPRQHAERVRRDDAAVLASGGSATYEEEFLGNGQPDYIHTLKSVCRDKEGRVIGLVGFSRDMTERRRLEQELKQRERDLREAHRIAKLGSWNWVRETGKVTWSDEVYRIFDRDPGLGEPRFSELIEWYTPESRARLNAAVEAAVSEGKPYELDLETVQPDGSTRWIMVRGEVEEWADGKVAKLHGTLQEITDRKRIEAQVALSENRYRSLVLAASQIVWTINPDGEQMGTPREWQAFTGQTDEEVRGWGWMNAIHPDDREIVLRTWQESVAAGAIYNVEHRVRRHDGEYRNMAVGAVPVRDAAGTIVEWVGMVVDITEQKQAEEALRESEGRFRKLFDSNLLGIGMPNRFGGFKESNDELLRMMGYSREDLEAGLFRWDLMTPPEYRSLDVAHIAEAAERGSCTPYEKEYIRKDGIRVPVLVGYALLDGSQDDYIGFVMDLTPQKRMELALRRSEKLAMAGRFAASVAHEINNPLAAVMNTFYLALRDETMRPETRGYLKMAEQELSRVAQITTQTLRFHKQSKSSAPADVAEIMESVFGLFSSRLTAKKITVERDYDTGAQVECFSDEMRQVFANLVSNAMDAMPGGGRVRVRVRKARAWDEGRTVGVRVTVADTGRGIPAAMSGRIFEPFFSTKESTGIGLGLWVSQGIVRKHHGRIALRSRTSGERHGTVVSLFFPVSAAVPIVAGLPEG